jgi:ABC-2 type transport system ATP-binding protein
VRRRTAVVAGVLAGLVAVVAGAAVARGDDAVPVKTQVLSIPGVPEPGLGPVTLDATLYLPQGVGRAPAVILAHGFGGSKDDVADQARALAGRGYVTLAYTARGFGRSGGLIHLDAPDFEVADASKLIDLLAARPEVQLDAPGDPRVGVAGGSYGGGLALLVAGHDHRVDAIAPEITWNDLRQALFPQFVVGSTGLRSSAGVDPVAAAGVFKKAWAGVFFSPQGGALASAASGAGATSAGATTAGASASGTAGADAVGPTSVGPTSAGSGLPALSRWARCGRFADSICTAYEQVAATGRPTPALLDLLAASSASSVLGSIKAPTLLVQGTTDSLFPLSEADANARGITANGTPVKVIWFSGGHDGAATDTENDRITAISEAWFDRYLKRDGSPPDTRFEVTVPAVAVSSADGRPTFQIRAAAGEPGVTSSAPPATRTLRLTGDEQVVQAPAGGSPAAVTAVPGLGSVLSAASSTGSALSLGVLPGQAAVFGSAPLQAGVHLVGGSRVTVHVAGDGSPATLFASLYDVAPDGSAVLPKQLVSPLYLPAVSAAGRDVTIALPAVVRDVAVGHRLRLVIATTDQAYALPAQPHQYRISPVAGQPLQLTVPDAAMQPISDTGVLSLWPYALALLLATAGVIGAGWWLLRRRCGIAPDPGLVDVPLAIEGLGKAYGDGFRAVSDLSFRVEPGWVLGLLGPNGAGKTTTLRMLMGLIRPTEGRILVFGHTISAGAPVLSRVGAFVEGPGFLPHVSGATNLRLYWQSTGRPDADAHLEDALEIAGLGDDVQRKVKTYSHGMRQRLAIAQAMLGLPDLLVLDEPTNGLDPPQIREMREVLSRYAATGRTVVVSSHLLSEVEQTCTHVVVMHQGRLVAEGPVAELVGSATLLVVDVDDPPRGAKIAAALPGAQNVELSDTGFTLNLLGTPRGELVRALVDAGLSVDRVSPQRGLEQAFLALVGEGDH